MIELALIGIGTGNPDHLTGEAVRAIGAADCVLLPAKRAETAELLDLRRTICAAHAAPDARIVEFALPVRDAGGGYRVGVDRWHAAIAAAWHEAIAANLPGGGRLALLVWGDPSLYDSALRIAGRLAAGGMALAVTVVPGITSLQALTAAHAIPLNAIGAPVLVTTGRRLAADGWPPHVDTLAVMLDGECAFESIDPAGVAIWWGAYLGMAHEALLAGPIATVAPAIRARRAELRARHGWIMDAYLLRRNTG